jgi:hypothetical protein
MTTLLHIFAAIGILATLLVVSVIILVAEDSRNARRNSPPGRAGHQPGSDPSPHPPIRHS